MVLVYNPLRECTLGVPPMVQQVKDPSLPHLWHRSNDLDSVPGPGTSICHRSCQKRKKENALHTHTHTHTSKQEDVKKKKDVKIIHVCVCVCVFHCIVASAFVAIQNVFKRSRLQRLASRY